MPTPQRNSLDEFRQLFLNAAANKHTLNRETQEWLLLSQQDSCGCDSLMSSSNEGESGELQRRSAEAGGGYKTPRRTSESLRVNNYNWAKNPEFTPDRGAGYYQLERQRLHKVSLVESGKHAGRSRVCYKGGSHRMFYHLWVRDFFTSVGNLKLQWVILAMFILYASMYIIFGLIYMLLDVIDPSCFDPETFQDNYVNYYIFSMVTQQTIGYGVRAPEMCWSAAILISIHSVLAMLIDSIFLGIIFARISHPRRRGRSIFLSDSAVVARRDGVLKFMFRLADVRPTTVMSPVVKCHMYTFGHGRKTAEGEFIPCRIQEMMINYIDGNMLLPVTVEHNIDERSPLFGHTRGSLEAMGTEIVVTFEGANEFGDTFSARQSYLPNEIHWGFMFSQTIFPCYERNGCTQHVVDLTKFHEVEPQEENMNKLGNAYDLSQKVVGHTNGKIPSSLLGENTIAMSDIICVTFRDGTPHLTIRVGDSYQHQMMEAHIRAFIYRWNEQISTEGEISHMQVEELTLSPAQLFLKYPCIVSHKIDENSPLSAWKDPQGIRHDAMSEIVFIVEGVQLISSNNLILQKTYKVNSQVRYGYAFESMMIPPNKNKHGDAIVQWEKFHKIQRLKNVMVPVPSLTQLQIKEPQMKGDGAPHPPSPLPFSFSRFHNYGTVSQETAIKEQAEKGNSRISKKRSNSVPELVQNIQIVKAMERERAEPKKRGILKNFNPIKNVRRFSSYEMLFNSHNRNQELKPVISQAMSEVAAEVLDQDFRSEGNNSSDGALTPPQRSSNENPNYLSQNKNQQQQQEKQLYQQYDFSFQNTIYDLQEEANQYTANSNEDTGGSGTSGASPSPSPFVTSPPSTKQLSDFSIQPRIQNERIGLKAVKTKSQEAPVSEVNLSMHDTHYDTYHGTESGSDWKTKRSLTAIQVILEKSDDE